ncbi:MAG: hypothetical protein Q8R18_01970 [bacterium]|nr:hypothetical protein [bacterium]
MAEEQGSIQEVSEDVRYNGKSIKGQSIPGPGSVEFVQQLRRADGRIIPVVQRIIVPADLFAKEELKIEFDVNIPTIQAGNDFPVRFKITKGELYPGDQIQISFSSQGADNVKNFSTVGVVAFDKKEFLFLTDRTKNIDSDDCYIALNIVSSASELLSSTLSNRFAIKKKNTTTPPSSSGATIDIELYSLTTRQKIQAGTKLEVKWRLEPKDLKTEMLVYSKIGKDNNPYQLISNLGLVFDRGVFTWNISENIPDTTEAYIKVSLPLQKIEKIFGPFFIIGGKSVRPPEDEDIKRDIPMIEQLLKQGLSLPKRKLFAFRNQRELLVAQFALDLVYKDNSDLRMQIQTKVPVAISKLEAIKKELENSGYASTPSTRTNYDAFVKVFEKIEKEKGNFLQLSDRKRMTELRDMGSFALDQIKKSEEFEELFNKAFSPGLKHHDWLRIYSEPEKLAFILREKDVHKSTTITHLYNFFDMYYDKLIILDALFAQIKTILTQVRKDLKIQ